MNSDQAFISSAAKILLQLWLEKEFESWNSVGLGEIWLKTLPEYRPERAETCQIQAPQISEGQDSGQLQPSNLGASWKAFSESETKK